MKFPHNTDSFAYYLAGIAQIDDHRDYMAILIRENHRAHANAPGGEYRRPGQWINKVRRESEPESPAVLRLQERLAGVRS